ncbi:hypothetical protein GCM10023205_40680 [Yinghuangia aomiensis]|uniref:Uncharacterized protein n=1 Tax=Yinghuangia aomiensis TaxID=676205 RepID=A0ABP9HH31_9ACTN
MARGESRMSIRTYTAGAGGDRGREKKRLQVVRPHDGFPPPSVFSWPACTCPRCVAGGGK